MSSYSFQPTKAISAAWKIYTPPPLRTKSTKSIFTGSGQSGSASPCQKAIHCSLVAGLDHHVVVGKPWPPRCPGRGVGINRRGADRNFEATGGLQDTAQQN